MTQTIETKSDFEPYKKKAFDAFILWLSLPAVLRRPPAKANSTDFAYSLGIDDDEVLCLIEIKTQKQFAEHFGVDTDTLTSWKQKAQAQQALEDLRRWAQPLTKNVMLSLYNRIIRGNAQPQHFKLWFQVVNGWSERLTLASAQRRISTVKIQIIDPTGHE